MRLQLKEHGSVLCNKVS